MTIHASKGREADRVVIDTALTQRVVSGMVDDPDSEARVFYVGITRARHRLDIVHGDNGYDL
jgi:superfamily I DNA/RNA helicase